MKVPKLSPIQQIVITGVVLTFFLLAIIFFLIMPQVINLGALRAEENTARQELDQAKTALKQLEDLKRTSRRTESDLLRLERKMPEDAELPSLIIQIEDVSKKSGITFTSIKPSAPTQKDEYKEVPLEIMGSGYFYPLLDFLYRIEKLPRLITITSLEIKLGKDGAPSIDVTIKANAYILTPGVKGAAAGGSAPAGGATSGGGTTGSAATGAASGSATSGGGGTAAGGAAQ